jgi:phage terminase small subunit
VKEVKKIMKQKDDSVPKKRTGKGLSESVPSPFPDCIAFSSLPYQHQLFVLAYVKEANGQQAAIEAKFSPRSAKVTACRLLTRANLVAAINEIKSKLFQGKVADAQEIREFLSHVMRGDIGEVCSWNDGGLSFNSTSEGMDKAKRRLIKKISVKEKTSPKGDFTEVQTSVELHDPLRAAEMLGKDLGMFKEDSSNNQVAVTVVIERSSRA